MTTYGITNRASFYEDVHYVDFIECDSQCDWWSKYTGGCSCFEYAYGMSKPNYPVPAIRKTPITWLWTELDHLENWAYDQHLLATLEGNGKCM